MMMIMMMMMMMMMMFFRLRVANLCCSGEEKIIYASLQEVTGIEDIAVNIIGR